MTSAEAGAPSFSVALAPGLLPLGAVAEAPLDGEALPAEHFLGAAVLDVEHVRSLATLERRFWSELHTQGEDAPFVVRGPTYLKARAPLICMRCMRRGP